MEFYTWGGQGSILQLGLNGGILAGREWWVYTAKNGTRITALLDTAGNSIGNKVTSPANGDIEFRINSRTWPTVWLYRPAQGTFPEEWWGPFLANEIMPQVPQAIDDAAEVLAMVEGATQNANALGAVAGQESSAGTNTSIINAALELGNVYLPAGEWWVNNSIKVPSSTSLTGAGPGRTVIRMASGINRNYPVVTNASNNLAPRTSPDTYIHLADFSVDGNSANRVSAPYPYDSETGSGVSLACVEHALVERVHSTNVAAAHSFDVMASTYARVDETTYPSGPSRWVTFRDCIGGSSGDDCFTTHASQYIWFENCVAWNEEGAPRNTYSNGFEVDDASLDVTIQGCYAYKFHAGVQIKGHNVYPPARRVRVVDTTADSCQYGFDIWWNDLDPEPAGLPNYSIAADVWLKDCKTVGLYDVQNGDPEGAGYHPALRVRSYNNVHVENFLIRDCPQSNVILEYGCSNVTIDGLVAENVWNNPYNTDPGVVSIYGDAGENITINNIEVRGNYALERPIVYASTSSRKQMKITNIRGKGTGAASSRGAVEINAWTDGWVVEDVFSTGGFQADIKINSGGAAGTLGRQFMPRETVGTAAPTSGTWTQGDRCWNRTPSTGGTPGWVCTSSGTPGTWKAMANLA